MTSAINVVDHYNQTLNTLDEVGKISFLLRTARLASACLEAENKPNEGRVAFGKKKWRGTTKVYNASQQESLKRRYFAAAGVLMVPTTLKMEDEQPLAIENTKCCDEPDILMLVEHAVCTACGKKVHDSAQFANNFADASIAASRTINIDSGDEDVTVLDKSALVKTPLLRLQGMRISCSFKENEWSRLYHNVTRGIEDVSAISCQMINRRLQNGDKKFAKDIYVVWEKVTGNALKAIPDSMLWLINYKIANHLVVPTTQQKTRIVAMTLLYKCFQLCGDKDHMEMLIMQNAAANLNTFDSVWRRTCEKHNLRYIA